MMQTLQTKLDKIPGVDYNGALKRLAYNTALYEELFQLFFIDPGIDRLKASLCSKDYQGAIIESHSIKGTAANLGLMHISSLASQINICLTSNEEEKAEDMVSLLEHECGLLQSIAHDMEGGSYATT